MVAATAVALDLTLVAHDTPELARVADPRLEDLEEPLEPRLLRCPFLVKLTRAGQ